MSGSYNCVTLVGNLGADPEIKSFQNGGKICNLRIATSEAWRDKTSGERKERTDWHSVVIQNEGLAGVAERFLRKGSKVLLVGRLQTRKWQDQSGQDRYSTEVVIGFGGTLTMLDGKRDGQSGGQETTTTYYGKQTGGTDAPIEPQRGSFADDLNDDIPFISCRGVW